MQLSHTQKNYIKKNIKKKSVEEISQILNVPKQNLLDYLNKKWGEAKLQSFLTKSYPENNISKKKYGFKLFIKNHWPNLCLLIFLIIITYANSLNNAFLSDDLAEIVNKPNVGSLKFAITSHPFGFIRLIFYWLAFHIGGLNPILFRSINIFFHLGSTLLIYILFNLIYSKRLALFVAAIFAVHPAISEAVVWISGGSYPQYTFFFLLSFLFYILSAAKNSSSVYIFSKGNYKYYWASILTFVLSFMSHPQMPLLLFLVFPIWEFCFGNLKKEWKKTIPFLVITSVFLVTSLTALPERETTLQSVHYQEKGVDNPFVLIPIAISSYFELIFFPKTLTLYHSELAFGTIEFSIRTIITVIFLIGVLISFKKNKLIFFWSSLFLIALSPTLTPFRLNWIVAERYLYLPILGILTILGLGLERARSIIKFKWAIYALLIIIIIVLSMRTMFRNIDWQSEDNLWVATGKTSPSSPNTHNNLGDVYGRHGDKEGALREFMRAIELKPNYADAYHNLGNTYRELGNLDKAMESYQMAAKLNPNLWQSYQNIAALYFQNKEYDKAQEFIQKAISINPKNLNLYINLGVVYLAQNDKEKAKQVFMQILASDPTNQMAQAGLAEVNKSTPGR